MSTIVKVIAFGIVSGLIWTLIVTGMHFDSAKSASLVLLAGAVTGVAVSIVLKAPLAKCGTFGPLFLGLISLPFGAFVFGVLSSIFGFADWSSSQYGILNPILIGCEFALISVISLCAILYFPLAVLTTYILSAVIHSGRKQINN